MNLSNWDIRNSIKQGEWTLFLDRDGVINRRLVGDYVKNWDEFEFLPGVLEAISLFAQRFNKVFIVTNQQGVGKGLMSADDLHEVHHNLKTEVENVGGRIDSIYYCPDLANTNSENRKPKPGMAYQAKNDFPEIDLKKSIMVGDSLSDMEFGINAGMFTVYIGDFNSDMKIDAIFTSLEEFSKEL